MVVEEMPTVEEDEVLDVKEVDDLEFEEVKKMMLEEEMTRPSQLMNMDLVAKRSLPPDFLKSGSREEILAKAEGVSHLRLDRERIHRLQEDVLSHLPRLTNLYLQFNRVEDTSALACCTGLRFLTLANNFISEVRGLAALPSLMFLDLGDNDIQTEDKLVDALPTSLIFLNIQGNPVCPAPDDPNFKSEDYDFLRECLAAALPRLKKLDDSEVSLGEKRRAREVYNVPAFSDEEEDEEELEEMFGNIAKEDPLIAPGSEKPTPSWDAEAAEETVEIASMDYTQDEEEGQTSTSQSGGAAAVAAAAMQNEEETRIQQDKEKLRAIVNLTLDPTADSTSALEASIVEARQVMSRTKEHIIQRSRSRINQDRKGQVAADSEIKELRTSIQASLRASANGPLSIDAIYKSTSNS